MAQSGAFWGYGYYGAAIGNPGPEVEPTGQRGNGRNRPAHRFTSTAGRYFVKVRVRAYS